jgi:hypothetical protein
MMLARSLKSLLPWLSRDLEMKLRLELKAATLADEPRQQAYAKNGGEK